jgi:hypothetical protein
MFLPDGRQPTAIFYMLKNSCLWLHVNWQSDLKYSDGIADLIMIKNK